jgi:hypothetical protein
MNPRFEDFDLSFHLNEMPKKNITRRQSDFYFVLPPDGTPTAPPEKAKGPEISLQPLLCLVAPAGLAPTTKRL